MLCIPSSQEREAHRLSEGCMFLRRYGRCYRGYMKTRRWKTDSDHCRPIWSFLLKVSPLIRQAVWEIRSVRPAPSIRVLVLFAKKNVFVATNFAFREDLGEWQSREWKNVKRAALAGWRRLFHPYDPLESTNIQNLVTGAINGKYFK